MSSTEKRKKCLKGCNVQVKEIRRTGKSTALALRYIADAIENQQEYIEVKDHFPTEQASKYLLQTIMSMCKQLNFTNIKTLPNRNVIKSDRIGLIIFENGTTAKIVE